jgi:hypothetical protein
MFEKLSNWLKQDLTDEQLANYYKFLGYFVVIFQIFMIYTSFWLCVIETVILSSNILIILIDSSVHS